MSFEYIDRDGATLKVSAFHGSRVGEQVYVYAGRDGAYVKPEDAPAVALAILWAADTPDNHADVHCAISSLIEHERTRTRLAEREAEDAKVVEFHTAIGANLNRIERHHRDLYNAARKFFEES